MNQIAMALIYKADGFLVSTITEDSFFTVTKTALGSPDPQYKSNLTAKKWPWEKITQGHKINRWL